MALFGCEAEIASSLGKILRNALAVHVQHREVALRFSEAPVGREAVESSSLAEVLRHAPAVFAEHRKVVYSFRHALIGC